MTGGIGAAITGGNFWQGMQQGLITTGLNHVMHPIAEQGDGGPGDPPVYDKFDRSQQAILSMTPTERWESFKIFAEASTFALGGEIFSGIKLLSVGFRTRFGWGGLLSGGKTFSQYKYARGGTKTLMEIATSSGNQRISTEFHHIFFTQRMQRAYNLPNWLVNNRFNVWRLNTIQHSLIDSYRFRFLDASFKTEVGWFKKYNWFSQF